MRASLAVLAVLALSGCVHRAPTVGYEEEGLAGDYGPGFEGKRTASGAIFHAEGMTCAHRTLPFGSVVEVERTDVPRRVRVTVTDRGPYVSGRIVDLTVRAARELGILTKGVAPVRLRVVRAAPRR